MKIALYLRVSTSDQTTENQKRDLLRYCESRKWEVVKIFEDTGISGTKHDRPALNELMDFARKGNCQAILVARFDRFARSTQHLLEALKEFQSLGVDFISYSEGVDTSTAAGKMIFTFLSAVSEFEVALIRSRVKSGIARAKAQGVKCGRPRAGFDVARAVAMQKDGKSLREIGRELGVGCATVYRTLSGVSKSLAA
ncbi:MAG: recombinase family protein [bacterium]